MTRYRNRAEAGRLLANRLVHYADRDDVIVLGLPRGGVPVAFEVARALGAPLDVFLVRKLGVPGHEELAMGAIASNGTRVLNAEVLAAAGMTPDAVEAVAAREKLELDRQERAYRGTRPPPDLDGKVVILVDDGLATGATMMAAVEAVREEGPARVVVAVPVAEPDVCEELRRRVDDGICLSTPQPLRSVGAWYDDFAETGDYEVRKLLEQAARDLDEGATVPVHELAGAPNDYDDVIERAAAASYVLIGEATHGTDEFYRERAEITKRLIAEAGYTTIAVEADWPDAYRVNRYVQGESDDDTADEALSDFRRFPVWMWRNRVVEEFVGWLRDHNDGLADENEKAGFYGLDLYSLHRSMEAVVAHLEEVDAEAAQRARERYSCFDHFGPDPQVYAYEAGIAGAEPCEREAVDQLIELQANSIDDTLLGEDRHFYAEQNARLVANAERYYRAVYRGGALSWNLRDRHMAETLEALVEHLRLDRGRAKVVVWAHNSHVGDARATELGRAGELNLGQLVRERHRRRALLVGFTTFSGTVSAATEWGGAAERMRVRRAITGSWEELFHRRRLSRFLVDAERLAGTRLERAIGVVYVPQTERQSHYFQARLANQFDFVVHIDATNAVEPLAVRSERLAGDLPETFPWGV
ncbi:MAG: Erythromycin esterase [Solirubrobacterales bacterium]|nr:Erythromycin esterase [Solirubrobacterales bacterium]